MTTLATLKSRIASDIDDTAGTYSADIADAITRAIEDYQTTRFDFNETRDETFSTVADQRIYTESDDSAIPLFYGFDQLNITVAGQVRPLDPIKHETMEHLSDNSASTGEPYSYAYFNRSIQLYPIPDDAYTVRMVGHIKKPEPASDAETGNVWMVEAYQLIRCKAKWYLATDVMDDDGLAARMERAAAREEGRLGMQTSKRFFGDRCIEGTSF